MAVVSSWIAPVRSLPAPSPPPRSTICCRHRGLRGGLALSSSSSYSSSVRRSPAAAVSSRIRPPPSPLLRRRTPGLRRRSPRRASTVAFAQFNVAKVLATAWRVAKDGVEAGTNLVPDSVPRSMARIGVAVVAGTVALFLLKSLLSTALFALAVMGLVYFAYIALNAGEGPSGGVGTGGSGTTTTDEESLEEARRIMEKYK